MKNRVYSTKEQRRRYRYYLKKIREQRFISLVLLVCCVWFVWSCFTGINVEDHDITAALILAPISIYGLFSKRLMVY